MQGNGPAVGVSLPLQRQPYWTNPRNAEFAQFPHGWGRSDYEVNQLSVPPFRIIVLGAGFSRPGGLPLTNELLPLVLDLARRIGRAERLVRDLQEYCEYANGFNPRQALRVDTPADIPIEKFVSYLDIRNYLLLKGSDSGPDEGDSSQILIRYCIGSILYDAQSRLDNAQWALYEAFAKRLTPEDVVITFNYDSILETACERSGVKYRLCPYRYKSVNRFGGTLIGHPGEVIIYKVHGSIDWFDISTHNHEYEKAYRNRAYRRIHHEVFDKPGQYEYARITGDPYPEDDPLRSIYRVTKGLGEYYHTEQRFSGTPLIISPSSAKLIHLNITRHFWNGFHQAGYGNSQMIIIGFSFAGHDEFVRLPIASAVRSFQEPTGLKTVMYNPSHLVFVDRQDDMTGQAAFMKRLSFIDWTRCNAMWDGLRIETLDAVFPPVSLKPEYADSPESPSVPTLPDAPSMDEEYEEVRSASCQYNDMLGECALDWQHGSSPNELAQSLGIDTKLFWPVAFGLWRSTGHVSLHIYAVSTSHYGMNFDMVYSQIYLAGGVAYVYDFVIENPDPKILDKFKLLDILVRARGGVEAMRVLERRELTQNE